MLAELCQELRNWFDVKRHIGVFKIQNGHLDRIDGVQSGQYIRIVGSVFNDGVYQYPPEDLTDETFDGGVWLLAIPKDVVKLSEEIDAWNNKYCSIDSAAMSPFNSESFGGYSYSKTAGGASGSANSPTSWQSVFAKRLNRWRKI